MLKQGKKKGTLSRVDVQVFLLAAFMVVLSSVCIFVVSYRSTYADTLLSLTERVESIYLYLEQELDPHTFEIINSKKDMNEACYKEMKELFFNLKKATGVQYLYTAKRAEDGTLVYVIDGLDYSAQDFRYPGDPIEEEIVASLERALDNERVMPADIKTTTWGNIFIAYLPIHNSLGEVIGAIGIEFEAEHQYSTYQRLRRTIPFVMLFVCSLSGVAALILFRRLSNPLYQDLANTDALTGLKNRNAYEMDTRNLTIQGKARGTGVLLADLNGLKKVNDTLGHDIGDLYIRAMADALCDSRRGGEVCYRVGGDEFVVLIPHATIDIIKDFVALLEDSFLKYKDDLMPHASFSIGWAICSEGSTDMFDQAYRAADSAMYEYKRNHYASLL